MDADLWILVFMLSGQPMANVGTPLDVCLGMAVTAERREREQAQKEGRKPFRAHCWNPAKIERRYPKEQN